MHRRRVLTALFAAGLTGVAACMDTTDEQPAGEAASTDSEAGGDAAGANNTDTNQLDGVSGRSTDGNATDEKRSETPAGLDWPTGPYADYDTAQVTVRSDDKAAASVRAAIADTAQTRYTGLSNATALPDGAGMLFVFTDEGDRTFVMREMDFGLDIIYANADRTITSVHHADAPSPNEDGNEQDYPGYGQYVLEVPQFWTDRNDITVGDRISFTL